MEGRATLRDERALRAWLLRITLNVCRQWRRGSFGRRLRLTQSLPDDGTDSASLEWLSLLMADPGGSDHTGALRWFTSLVAPSHRSITVGTNILYLGAGSTLYAVLP